MSALVLSLRRLNIVVYTLELRFVRLTEDADFVLIILGKLIFLIER